MKKSTIIFILANLVVMSVPYWTTLPLNRHIAHGRIQNRDKEEEGKLQRRKLEGITDINLDSDSNRIGLRIVFSDHDELVFDTSYNNYVNVKVEGSKLSIFLDDAKYEAWHHKMKNVHDEESHDGYYTNDYEYADEEGGRNFPTVTLKLYVKRLSKIKAQDAVIAIDGDESYPFGNSLYLDLDTSSVALNYYESEMDSSGCPSHRVSVPLAYPIEVVEKNGSEVTFSFLHDIDLRLTLKNNTFDVLTGMEPFKKLHINYDRNSDIHLSVSDLDKIKLVKTY
ncbi:MAG TPA: hypothetical protein VL947_14005 [Cytophagales bacterium]|nr:hypothetical protein [Cytophagales bacterium]